MAWVGSNKVKQAGETLGAGMFSVPAELQAQPPSGTGSKKLWLPLTYFFFSDFVTLLPPFPSPAREFSLAFLSPQKLITDLLPRSLWPLPGPPGAHLLDSPDFPRGSYEDSVCRLPLTSHTHIHTHSRMHARTHVLTLSYMQSRAGGSWPDF